MQITAIPDQHRVTMPEEVSFAEKGDLLRVERWLGGKIGFVNTATSLPVNLVSGDQVMISGPSFPETVIGVYDEPETNDPLLRRVFRIGRRTMSVEELKAKDRILLV